MIDRFNQQLDHIVNVGSNVYRGSTVPATKTSSVDRSQPEKPEKIEKKDLDDKDIRGTTGKGFFESRNMLQLGKGQVNKTIYNKHPDHPDSAFDKIGNLGELEPRTQAADGDIGKYERLLQARCDKTRMLFDRARLRRESSVQNKNMLEWLRSQKDR